ncbi:GNAT family N-acetyltransferase [Paenibacillus segetis]|uniref:Acetyltransferase n=1 Tax=Paenibacillus segetis TaxID=1325360 RepID=A0ABQ1YI72_9BACL|nr:GNAT family N-acetyltransferase [Paenibacillus segetis]GGH27123.1 acetyltransferase [Paenibacillus segetis]
MIAQFIKQDFYKIRHITDKCDNIEVRAVVSGINPGQVYVDHPTMPTAALIWIQGQAGFQVVGDPHSKSFLNDLEPYMRTYIEPNLIEQNISCVEIGADETWTETLQVTFKNRNLSNDIQHVFKLNEDMETNEIHTDGVIIRKLDEDVLKSRRFENQSYLEGKISRFWDSIDDFLQHGFGYIAEQNNTVVSSCFSAFVADHTHAIDIETIEGYRKRNLGALVARAFVEECKREGIHPYWDCTPENTGSIRLAKSVGMSLDFNYRIFWYNMN